MPIPDQQLLEEADQLALARVLAEARTVAFKRFVRTLEGMVRAGPVAGGAFATLAWPYAPHDLVLTWGVAYAANLLAYLLLIRHIRKTGPDRSQHSGWLAIASAVDGGAWGAIAACFFDWSGSLNTYVGIFLTGVAVSNAAAHVLSVRASWLKLFFMGLVASIGLLINEYGHQLIERVATIWVMLGVSAYLSHVFSRGAFESIRLQLSNSDLAGRLQVALRAAESLARTDGLTGAPNRRAFNDLLQLHVSAAGRQTFSMLLFDIDRFKCINDAYGHPAGDEVLKAFFERVRGLLRPGDICARFGGEEFVALLPGATLTQAADVAERLRAGVADLPLVIAPPISVTISIGAGEYEFGEGIESLLSRVDKAAYLGKQAGRNCVVCASVWNSARKPSAPRRKH